MEVSHIYQINDRGVYVQEGALKFNEYVCWQHCYVSPNTTCHTAIAVSHCTSSNQSDH